MGCGYSRGASQQMSGEECCKIVENIFMAMLLITGFLMLYGFLFGKTNKEIEAALFIIPEIINSIKSIIQSIFDHFTLDKTNNIRYVYRLHIGNVTIPLTPGSGHVKEWEYFEINTTKKLITLAYIVLCSTLVYYGSYIYCFIMICLIIPLHKLAKTTKFASGYSSHKKKSQKIM